MSNSEKKFKIVIPAELSKGEDGEWKVRGLASTASRDQQGEIILQDGIDTSAIEKGRAFFNWDHQRGPENILGPIDTYQRSEGGLVVEGRLFKNHEKAKSVYGIMSSMGKSDHGRMGMSVEGSIISRAGADGKIIKKCLVKAVALTMNPVNSDTYADLAKSLSGADEVDFNTNTPDSDVDPDCSEATFTVEQVSQLVQKALTAGEGYTKAPADRSGGEALSTEDMDSDIKNQDHGDTDGQSKKKKKKLKKMCKALYKSQIGQILDNIQKLYPENSRDQLWEALKDRLNTRFPQISENESE